MTNAALLLLVHSIQSRLEEVKLPPLTSTDYGTVFRWDWGFSFDQPYHYSTSRLCTHHLSASFTAEQLLCNSLVVHILSAVTQSVETFFASHESVVFELTIFVRCCIRCCNRIPNFGNWRTEQKEMSKAVSVHKVSFDYFRIGLNAISWILAKHEHTSQLLLFVLQKVFTLVHSFLQRSISSSLVLLCTRKRDRKTNPITKFTD